MLNRKPVIQLPLYLSQPSTPSKFRRFVHSKSRFILLVGAVFVCFLFLGALYLNMTKNELVCFHSAPLLAAEPLKHLSHLIIIAGHAVWLGGATNGESDTEWILESYQKGEGKVFAQHVRAGIELMQADENSLLVFSGGQTRLHAGPLSESQSYYRLSMQIDSTHSPERRTTEEFARDSYENVVFSIARFHEITSRYPEKITIVSFEFKRERFVSLHREAVRFPLENFQFIGINPDIVTEETLKAEERNALIPFSKDPYACLDPVLRQKRIQRNPFRRQHSYLDTCPELRDLIEFCPTRFHQFFPGRLPWSHN
ncbi:hypothetical protein SJAG_00190 [Schizosaccharomyces japonicus yFS275]|uniref:DUF218 domain-containing protein n=1 Tax=Schizosaccharomyces japonicus (strain yFS275 / FY16936) TaxID=402676 RepID=B6JXP9_SCHJY|nr:hypothetical protein SJAG_00190 [Schizosaccharomyces japonicus yFS275]EEB05193.1 hypothetical protein SJAG_00190 [Schizosaccharomyces japonicus yFS275]